MGEATSGETAPPRHRTLVVLPTYDERATLPGVVRELRRRLPDAHVLVIDDASPDGTGAVADALAATDAAVSVRHRGGKLGLGTAYAEGFRHAIDADYRRVVAMDSDGSHRLEDLPALIEAADAGAGLVIGARWVDGGRIIGWPHYRRWVSRTGTMVARIALRSKLRDLTSGFRVIDVDWLARLPFDGIGSEGYGFQVETAWALEHLGCPIAEVPITFVERRGGRSKMTCGIAFEALRNVLRHGWRLRTRGAAPPFARRGRSADAGAAATGSVDPSR